MWMPALFLHMLWRRSTVAWRDGPSVAPYATQAAKPVSAHRPGPQASFRRCALLSLPLAVLPTAASAQGQAAVRAGVPDVRQAEIAECRPGELVTWGDGQDRAAVGASLVFVYQHEGAPAWFSSALVMGALQRAAMAWAPCGVAVQAVAAPYTARYASDTLIPVRWHDGAARNHFGLADVGRRQLALGPSAFALLRERNPQYPAQETLQMVISHEMGHFFGLMAHSRRCVDVMSYYDDGKGARCQLREPEALRRVREYRALLPTACDIQRCRQLNGR